MKKPLRNSGKGFTLLELLITVVIITVLAALVVPNILSRVQKAKEAEAVNSLGAIRSVELNLHGITGKFVAAADESEIQTELGLVVGGGFYKYSIINADEDDFLALATPIGPLSNWLEEIGINKNGFVGSGGGSGGGSSGGSSGGSGGGSGGGSSGGGSGGDSGGGSGGVSSGGNSVTASGGYYYEVYAPENLVLIPNNQWLVLSFAPYKEVDFYDIERAEKTGDVLGEWQPLTSTVDCGWEDNVQNGKEYCYQAYTTVTLPSGEQKKSGASTMICDSAAPNTTYTAAITNGESKLDLAIYADPSEGAPSGAAEVAFLSDEAVPILFGQIQSNALAYLNPNTGALVLDVAFATQPSEFSAAILAHEALHCIWDKDWTDYMSGKIPAPQYGNNPDGTIRNEYAYYNEFSAFTTNAMAWQSFFPNTPDGNAAKNVFYNALDLTGTGLYNQMEASVMYFLDDSEARVSFPDGVPPNVPSEDPFYEATTLEILISAYGYDLASVY